MNAYVLSDLRVRPHRMGVEEARGRFAGQVLNLPQAHDGHGVAEVAAVTAPENSKKPRPVLEHRVGGAVWNPSTPRKEGHDPNGCQSTGRRHHAPAWRWRIQGDPRPVRREDPRRQPMTARTAAAPRTNLAGCAKTPVRNAVIDLATFRLDFEHLLERHGLRIDFSSIAAMKDAPALLALALSACGAQVDMYQSTHQRYTQLRAAMEATR